MSVKLQDILKLQSLKDARVVAGQQALDREIASISVLEYAEPTNLMDQFMERNRLIGSEIVITAFFNIKDDVDAQCEMIHALANFGEVGIILYYVGIVMKKLDHRLIKAADEAGIALIVMPEGKLNQQYSEVISEVMEAIIKDREDRQQYVSDVLGQLSNLPEHLRTMDAAFLLLRDRLKASLALTDLGGKILNLISWPASMEEELKEAIQTQKWDPSWWVGRSEIKAGDGPVMNLYLVRIDAQQLPPEIIRQACEIVQLFVSIWNPHHASYVISELVQAIMKDEPIKMRRLGQIFNIDVKALHEMWVVQPQKEEENLDKLSQNLQKNFGDYYKNIICAPYEKLVVVLTDGECGCEREELFSQVRKDYPDFLFAFWPDVMTTSEVQASFMLTQQNIDVCTRIFPLKKVFSSSTINIAAQVSEKIARGQGAIRDALRCLRNLDDEELKTLETFILDADSSVMESSRILNVHVNTVKYRIHRISKVLGADLGGLAEQSVLGFALALKRAFPS